MTAQDQTIAAGGTRPWESEFTVERIDVVAEVPELRVLHMRLEKGEKVPWHWHAEIWDRFYCLEGKLEIECRAPKSTKHLSPGDEHHVPPKTAHEVRNIGNRVTRVIVVQGVGPYDYHAVGHEHH